jgi:hypothetical protein
MTPAVTIGHGLTGVFLDPPYGEEAVRRAGLYVSDSGDIAADVRQWCLANGHEQRMRIALCGYEGEHNALERHGWRKVAWKARGGYANQSRAGNPNAERERVWFSPHCLRPGETTGQLALFGADEAR